MPCDDTLWQLMPDATAQAAHRAGPPGNRSMTMRAGMGPLCANTDGGDRSRHRGPPPESLARRALVLVMMPI
ncbi:MAG: hypothetical protein MI924_31190, partial [Chloroflexales bacterium]|nr:hypothetical protein [Chloroflexales bacterium]